MAAYLKYRQAKEKEVKKIWMDWSSPATSPSHWGALVPNAHADRSYRHEKEKNEGNTTIQTQKK